MYVIRHLCIVYTIRNLLKKHAFALSSNCMQFYFFLFCLLNCISGISSLESNLPG